MSSCLLRVGRALVAEADEVSDERPRLVTLSVPTTCGPARRDALIRRLREDDGSELVIAAFVGAVAAPPDVLGEQIGRLEAMLAHATDIITVLDADGAIQYSNAAAGHLTCLGGTSMNGTSAFELVHPDDQEFAAATFVDCLARPGPRAPFELRVRYADERWHDVEVVVNNLLGVPASSPRSKTSPSGSGRRTSCGGARTGTDRSFRT